MKDVVEFLDRQTREVITNKETLLNNGQKCVSAWGELLIMKLVGIGDRRDA